MRARLIWAGLALVVLTSLGLVIQRERIVATGTPMLLELAPRDPRSLMQGDYMRLAYALNSQAQQASLGATDGHLVVRIDERNVASFVRMHDPSVPLAPGEHLLRYRVRAGQLRTASEAFFFEEGTAGRYQRARYAELRVSPRGLAVLVGVRDAELRPLSR